jgi:hypothetical protein
MADKDLNQFEGKYQGSFMLVMVKAFMIFTDWYPWFPS